MGERIRIKNFGGLGEVTLELRAINIFIGKQASGKSVSAKLLYFFKGILEDILQGLKEDKTKLQIEHKIRDKFENYFPPESWPKGSFTIRYELAEEYIEISRPTKTLTISFSDKFKPHYQVCRKLIKQDRNNFGSTQTIGTYYSSKEFNSKYYDYLGQEFEAISKNNQVFVPAGRSFFASLQSSIFSLLVNNKAIDPFILEFGSFYERFSPIVIRDLNHRLSRVDKQPFFSKRVRSLIADIVGAEIVREDDRVYLVHEDGRRVQLPFSSSGQQETLPLSLMLAFFSRANYVSGGTTVYIEEPEAHLFPTAQKKMVELIATIYNESKTKLQFVITTHSPYILTSFNNLLHAGYLSQHDVDLKKLERVVTKSELILPGEVSAIAMQNGKALNLVDKKSGLISADILDQVSEDITREFDRLLAL